jgi:hypothetical protein
MCAEHLNSEPARRGAAERAAAVLKRDGVGQDGGDWGIWRVTGS